jgi:hypothetical protein
MNKIKKMLPANQIRAAVNETSVNEESRTVELTWTTGAKGLRNSWGGSYYEELSLDPGHVDLSRLNDGSHPLLAAHDDRNLDSVIGVVESASVDGTIGTAKVRFARDEISERVFQKVKDKILRNVSVGYSVFEYTDVSHEGDEIPTYRATRWQPAELSIVPIGFDKLAKVRNENVTENEVEIISRSHNLNKETAMSEKNQPVVQPSVDTEALKKEAVQAEMKRSADIRNAVRTAGLQESIADDLIARGVSTEDAKANVETIRKALEAAKPAQEISGSTRIEVGADEADKKREAITEALLHKVDPVNFKVSQGNFYADYGLLRAMEALVKRTPGQRDVQFATRVMSSSDLPYILGNVAEKSAQKRYQLAPKTWQRWASKGTLRNYKTHDSVRSGDFASLSEIKEGGEITRGSFGEEREQVSLKDYGKIMAFTRQMLINDDLSEISKVIASAGAAAARKENALVYEQLSSNPTMGDSVALFHATHANLGTAGAITVASIGEAIKLMKKQTSVDGLDKLNLSPRFLICSPDKEGEALQYLSDIAPAQASNVNPYSRALELVVDAELSGNGYYFAADQNLIETVKLFHLEGQEQPRVETRIDFNTESVEVKCVHSVAAKAMDHRGLVKNAGN